MPLCVTFKWKKNIASLHLKRKEKKTNLSTLIKISPKFMVYVILCAQPPDSITPFARKL